MRKIIYRFAALMCAVLFVLGAAGCAVKSNKQKLRFQHTAQDREVGETQSMIVYENHYAYGIHYPAIGVESIDSKIKAAAQEIADTFVSEVPSSKPKGEKPTLSADYKSYLVSDNGKNKYVSVVFEIKTDIADKGIKTDTIKTLVFDIPSGKLLSADDFFTDGYEKLASMRVVSYFIDNRLFNEGVGSDKFKQNTSADKKNFTKFSISADSLVFYFDSGTLFDEDKGCVEAVFKTSDIKAIFSAETAKALFGEAPSQQTTSEPESKKPNLPEGVKYIAFTFDDGPSKDATNRILDTLQKYNGRATFFVLGTRVGSYPDEVKRAYSMGCEIGSHSWSHANLRKISKQERKQEINKTNAIVKEVIGVEPTLFRVPYGDYKGIQSDFNLPLIQWSIDTEDWRYKDKPGSGRTQAQRNADMQKIISSVVDHATGGEIVLMHDLYDMTADGFSLDDKRSPVADNDIPDIIARFRNPEAEKDRQRTEKSFFVPKAEIVENGYDLSINKYKKTEYKPVEYPPTSEIMAQLRKLEKEIGTAMDELEEMLKGDRT